MTEHVIRVGTAGWSLPQPEHAHFPSGGAHLERYAALLSAAEINSSFHRPHRASTYARWAAGVPESFRFSVKLPRAITHDRRLVDAEPLLDEFLVGPAALGARLGCLLVQLPPKLALDMPIATAFLDALRARHAGAIAIEPRHVTWFTHEADAMLVAMRVARVAADPPRAPGDGVPGGFADLVYYRLHGSPRVYYSSYGDAYLDTLVRNLRAHAEEGRDVWCIFDNTASGAAATNARELHERLTAHP